jgi:pilus assembly protein Flp/PilA
LQALKKVVEMMISKNLVKRFLRSTEGATAIEYGLIAAGISLAMIPGIAVLGPQVQATFASFASGLAAAAAP